MDVPSLFTPASVSKGGQRQNLPRLDNLAVLPRADTAGELSQSVSCGLRGECIAGSEQLADDCVLYSM